MIVPTVKFVLYGSFACKRACGGGYLSGGKRQTYHAEKSPNLAPTYIPINPFDPALLLDISIFLQIDDELKIRSTNWKCGDEALVDPVATMFLPWKMNGGEKFLTRVVAIVG
jgi:hypothetical protein